MIRIAVVDDEQFWRETLCGYIERFSSEHQMQIDVECFRDGIGITSEYKAKYDIIFLDIAMNIQDGMSTARLIRKYDDTVTLIFITNMAKYAIQGYSVDAFNFVLKPVQYSDFSRELEKALHKRQKFMAKPLFVKTADGYRQIRQNSIIYVEHINKVLHIHMQDETIEVRMTLSAIETELNDMRFFCPHSGYLLNLYKITKVEKEYVLLGEIRIPLSRHRRIELLERISILMKGDMR